MLPLLVMVSKGDLIHSAQTNLHDEKYTDFPYQKYRIHHKNNCPQVSIEPSIIDNYRETSIDSHV